MNRTAKLSLIVVLAVISLAIIVTTEAREMKKNFHPNIPRTWDDAEIGLVELPLADAAASTRHVRSEFYYRIPVHKIYKSYPIYPPDKEPAGYFEWLKQQKPQVIDFDISKFKTEADWIKAGELVFDEPFFYDNLPTLADVRSREFYKTTGMPTAKDGTMPFTRYVIRERDKVEVGNLSCAICHTRVMPDGGVIKGAQGNFPFEKAVAVSIRRPAPPEELEKAIEEFRVFQQAMFAAPWLRPDPHELIDKMSQEELARAHDEIPSGVVARERSSLFFPVQVPDLIGVKDRVYLDHTGLKRHRSIGDMMRYAAIIQTGDDLASFGEFTPFRRLFGEKYDPNDFERYSDEQLYALALYIYSLKPPPNPNKFGSVAARGKKIFEREGCAVCHTPPLFTNNKLIPIEGFKSPEDNFKKYDILDAPLGTDPNLALKTRRGTGYYKVPSLKGVWYRGPFEHSGSVMTLEDWFDPRRLNDDYQPSGFRGFGVQKRAVRGHEYGLRLSAEYRRELIAYLRTL